MGLMPGRPGGRLAHAPPGHRLESFWMRAAFTLLLLSTPALGRVVLPSPRLSVRSLPMVGAPRYVAPIFSPALAPATLTTTLTPSLLFAPNNAPTPAPAPADLPAAQPAAQPAEQPAEAAAAEAAARFDGTVPAPEAPAVAVPALAAPEGAHPGWSVRAAKDEDAEWLAGVIAALRESRTGRRLLKDVDAMSAGRGRPVLVDVARISNNAEVRYDSGLLVMDKNHRRKPVRLAAPIMAHELQHVVQKASEFIPVDSLEMEVESYTIEARVWNELGLKPPPRSFARMAKTRLEKDPDGFVIWLAGEYKKNRLLHGSTVESYVEWLGAEREKNLKKIAAAEKRIRTVERVLERMRAAGAPAAQIEAHRHDDLVPAEANLRDYRLTQAWIDRDLGLLSTEEGRKRFREYSRAVIRRARAMGQKTQA